MIFYGGTGYRNLSGKPEGIVFGGGTGLKKGYDKRDFCKIRDNFPDSSLAFIRKRSILMEQLRGVAQSG